MLSLSLIRGWEKSRSGGWYGREPVASITTCASRRRSPDSVATRTVRPEPAVPALVTTSLAINAALRARGIEPDYVIGHSVGEFSALGAAGSIGISEAIALVRERGLNACVELWGTAITARDVRELHCSFRGLCRRESTSSDVSPF